MAGIKSRAWTVTVHVGHLDALQEPDAILEVAWLDWIDTLGKAYEAGTVDYAIISAELSKTNRPHLQGFVIINEEHEGKPTDLLCGHWLKARNLSGSRDYCAKAGIHIGKPGVIDMIEYGEWIDPGWNQTLRSRLIYEFTHRLKHGDYLGNLSRQNPAGVLLVGLGNLTDVIESGTRSRQNPPPHDFSPYYYIGRTETEKRMRSMVSWRAMEARAEKSEEE